MKCLGAFFEYEEERNEDLLRAFNTQLQGGRFIKNLYTRIVNMPSSRFWVSEERATIVVSRMLKGEALKNMRPAKREMYEEICRRVRTLQQTKPDACLFDLIFEVVSSPAPKFYLSPGSAKVIIHKIRKKCKTQKPKS